MKVVSVVKSRTQPDVAGKILKVIRFAFDVLPLRPPPARMTSVVLSPSLPRKQVLMSLSGLSSAERITASTLLLSRREAVTLKPDDRPRNYAHAAHPS